MTQQEPMPQQVVELMEELATGFDSRLSDGQICAMDVKAIRQQILAAYMTAMAVDHSQLAGIAMMRLGPDAYRAQRLLNQTEAAIRLQKLQEMQVA